MGIFETRAGNDLWQRAMQALKIFNDRDKRKQYTVECFSGDVQGTIEEELKRGARYTGYYIPETEREGCVLVFEK